jgi:hypothetical protein
VWCHYSNYLSLFKQVSFAEGKKGKKVNEEKYIKVMSDLITMSKEAPAGAEILLNCLETATLLLTKNISYGNSALEPLGVFGSNSAVQGIAERIDDKLKRIKNNQSYPGDNDIDDILGYLILYKIARNRELTLQKNTGKIDPSQASAESGGKHGATKED